MLPQLDGERLLEPLRAAVSTPLRPPARRRSGSDRTNRPLHDDDELLNSRLFLLQFSLAAEQTGVEFRGKQSVLKALHHPVQNRDDHFDVQISTQFAALQSEADEIDCAIRIFCDQKTVNFPLQN